MNKTIRKTMMLALLVTLAFIAFSVNANAATFVVNTTADTQDATAGNGICADSGGACSLRAAITEANALAGADIITLPAGIYTQTLVAADENLNAGGDFDITSEITINGAGSGTTIIEANALPNTATEKVIHCMTAATAVVINDVTIRHGNVATNVSGGGIRLETATTNLTLNRVVVTNNRTAGNGGGISIVTAGIVLNINDSTVSNNSVGSSLAGVNGLGAGINVVATATVNITNTMVTGNMGNSSNSNTAGAGINVSGIGAAVTITGSTISGNTLNSSIGNPVGGGVSITGLGATVTITGSTISNNSSTSTSSTGFGYAGGIYNFGATVNIINSSVTGNTASGFHGGVLTQSSSTNAATTTITNSSISNNRSTFGSGGVTNIASTASTFNAVTTITGSTISGNSATDADNSAGGILNFSDSAGAVIVNLTNSTVSGNIGGFGGGIYSNGSAATVNLNYSTVASNRAIMEGGGLYQDFTLGGVTNLKNSIVADNAAPTGPDIFGTITSQNYNHIENTAGGTFIAMANDVTGSDPQLGPLGNNGGTTQTHLPAATSPVVDTIPPGISDCGTTVTIDQRGFTRPSGAGCDKGSVEVQGMATPTPTPTPPPTPTPTPGGGGTCTPTTTVTEGDLFPGGIASFGVNSGPGSVTVDHVNAGTGLQSLTVVGAPVNAVVNIPAFMPGTLNPVAVTFTAINPALPVDFTLRAGSQFHAVFIRVRCGTATPTP